MGGFSLWHWLIVGIVILLLFGKGRFSSMMGDVASGLKSFKKGMAEEDDLPPGQATRELQSGTKPVHGGTVVDVTPAPTAAPTTTPDDVRRS